MAEWKKPGVPKNNAQYNHWPRSTQNTIPRNNAEQRSYHIRDLLLVMALIGISCYLFFSGKVKDQTAVVETNNPDSKIAAVPGSNSQIKAVPAARLKTGKVLQSDFPEVKKSNVTETRAVGSGQLRPGVHREPYHSAKNINYPSPLQPYEEPTDYPVPVIPESADETERLQLVQNATAGPITIQQPEEKPPAAEVVKKETAPQKTISAGPGKTKPRPYAPNTNMKALPNQSLGDEVISVAMGTHPFTPRKTEPKPYPPAGLSGNRSHSHQRVAR
ncbi:MAG: hypothetical protein GX130_07435 [Candidatus Hydrogenedens sp.]|jgi:hypothetical protein|nr:hypothetical protein [Candidatus Hydrogenedens sp.]